MNDLCELRLSGEFPISDDQLRMRKKQQETEMFSRGKLITIFKTFACLVTAPPPSQFTFKCILTAKILKHGGKNPGLCAWILALWHATEISKLVF